MPLQFTTEHEAAIRAHGADQKMITENVYGNQFLAGTLAILLLVSTTAGSLKPKSELPHNASHLNTLTPTRTVSLPMDIVRIDPSPDGRWMCCWTSQDDTTFRLWLSPTSQTHWVLKALGTGIGSWRKDSDQYAFGINRTNNGSAIAVLWPRGGQIRRINLPFRYSDKPSWSPDGQSLAFITGVPPGIGRALYGPSDKTPKKFGDPFQLVLYHFTASTYTVVPLHIVGYVSEIKWSPDGKSVAFPSLNRNGDGIVSLVRLPKKLQGELYDYLPLTSRVSFLTNNSLICSGGAFCNHANGGIVVGMLNESFKATVIVPDNDYYSHEVLDTISSGDGFIIAINRISQASSACSCEVLWGSTLPFPHLTGTSVAIPMGDEVAPMAAFSPGHHWLWVVSPSKKIASAFQFGG